MNTLPHISIVIPVLNQKENLKRLLDALREQEYPRDLMETIVVDNGSEDGTWEYISILPYIKVDRVTSIKSPYACRNKGIEIALNEWIFLIDSKMKIIGTRWLYELIYSLKEKKGIYPVTFLPLNSAIDISQWCEMISLFYYNMLADQGKAATGGCFVAHRSAFQICGRFDTHRSGGDVRWIQNALEKGYSIKTSANNVVYYTPKKFKAYQKKTARIGKSEYHQAVRQKVPRWKYVLKKMAEMRPPNPTWIYTCLKYHNEHKKSFLWYSKVWTAMWYFRVYQKLIALRIVNGQSD